MSALLSVSDAHVSYGKVEAVRSVSLDVADNEIVTIIGANGAGKTTLLNAIMGVLPLKGAAAFAGNDMAPLDIEDRVAAGGHPLMETDPGTGHRYLRLQMPDQGTLDKLAEVLADGGEGLVGRDLG